MSEEKNIPESKTTDDSTRSSDDSLQQNEENLQPVTEPELLPKDSDEQISILKSLPKESFGQTSENMEVHHHGHVHEKKKWKEYLFQFLMLFLAVFCGFLAEYQLEHKIEREKGEQYLRSFYEDLVTDTSTFNRVINAYEIKLAVLQGREECFDSLNKDIKSETCFWDLLFNTTYFPDLIYTDRTMQQLKNAGGLRLLKPVDADSILIYDNMLREFSKGETSQQEIQTTIRNTMYSLVSHQRFSESNEGQPVSFLFGNNRELLNRYFNQLMGYTKIMEDGLKELKNIKKRAFNLITYFKKKYDL